MDILLLLIPLSLVLVALIGAAFMWSVRSGQFDDLDGPAYRILADDDRPAPSASAEGGPGDVDIGQHRAGDRPLP